jgi:hypothetical protein
MQTIKDTVLEIKEIVFGEHNLDIEGYAEELANRSSLDFNEVKDMFNNLTLIYMQSKQPKLSFNKKRIWDKCEDNLMLQYVEIACREGATKKDALLDLTDILIDRTESSIPFRYYNHLSAKKEADAESSKETLNTLNSEVSENKDGDLLDVVVDIVENIETAGVDLNGLFKGILTLSQKAVENSNVDKLDALEGENAFLKDELDKEKEKNLSLQEDVAKLIKEFEDLKKEVEYFTGLNGKQKLQQLHKYNERMKIMIDKFGGVIAVGL